MNDANRPTLKVNDGPFRSLDEQDQNNIAQANRIRSRSLNPDVSSVRNVSRRVLEEIHFRNLNNRLADVFNRRHQSNPIENESSIQDLKSEYEKFVKNYEDTKKENTKLTLLHSRVTGELQQRNQHIARLDKEIERLKQNEQTLETKVEDYKLSLGQSEDTNTILEQELRFKVNLYEKQVAEMKKTFEMSYKQIETQIRIDLDAKYEAERQDLIETHLNDKNLVRENLERIHGYVLAEAQTKIRGLENKLQNLELEHDNLKNVHNEFVNQNNELKTKYDQEIKKWQDLLDQKNEINNNLLKENERLRLEFQEVYEVNFNLNEEIRKFRKILEAEEKRLSITPQSMSSPDAIEKDQFTRERDLGSPLTSSSMIEPLCESGKKRRRVDYEPDEQIELVERTRNQGFYVNFDVSNGRLLVQDGDKPQKTGKRKDEPANTFNIFSFWKK